MGNEGCVKSEKGDEQVPPVGDTLPYAAFVMLIWLRPPTEKHPAQFLRLYLRFLAAAIQRQHIGIASFDLRPVIAPAGHTDERKLRQQQRRQRSAVHAT